MHPIQCRASQFRIKPAICIGRRCDALAYKNNNRLRACNALESRFSDSIAQHKAQHMYTATHVQNSSCIQTSTQDNEDQVHYPDQHFVHNIIMMITSIKKLNVTRNASPDNAPNPIIILSNCEAKIFGASEMRC